MPPSWHLDDLRSLGLLAVTRALHDLTIVENIRGFLETSLGAHYRLAELNGDDVVGSKAFAQVIGLAVDLDLGTVRENWDMRSSR